MAQLFVITVAKLLMVMVKYGCYGKFHPVNDEELKLFKNKGNSGLKCVDIYHLKLLESSPKVMVKTKIESGVYFLFKVTTINSEIKNDDVITPLLLMEVWRGLPPDYVVEVTYLGTECQVE
ncbi:hypothetical protein RF11_14109 [Thelohanellus kitauei]|uniref:Cystatin domain-containing protein n=1 Tax=Thelohanellus kitauei TaxID=669202 RepID=A0A0C2I8Z2_THEKT|nr:hypothetical protein RF11_14109 [Thelohanellus kitauei]